MDDSINPRLNKSRQPPKVMLLRSNLLLATVRWSSEGREGLAGWCSRLSAQSINPDHDGHLGFASVSVRPCTASHSTITRRCPTWSDWKSGCQVIASLWVWWTRVKRHLHNVTYKTRCAEEASEDERVRERKRDLKTVSSDILLHFKMQSRFQLN